MNRQYVRGRNFEYRIRQFFEKRGCYVIRSAGSKGLFDLVVFCMDGIYLIQCKKYRVRKSEVREVREELNKNKDLWKNLKVKFLVVYEKKVKGRKRGEVVFEEIDIQEPESLN